MTSTKQDVLEFVEQLPDDFEAEDLEEEIVRHLRNRRNLLRLVRQAETDIEEGRTLSHEEAKLRLGIE